MADGFARATGRAGVCMASRGPGAANLVIAMHNAYGESIPVVALVGQVDDEIVHREAFEEVDLTALFAPVTKWSLEVHAHGRVPELVQRSIQVAQSGRPRPVMLSIPLDVQLGELREPLYRPRVTVAHPVPAEAELSGPRSSSPPPAAPPSWWAAAGSGRTPPSPRSPTSSGRRWPPRGTARLRSRTRIPRSPGCWASAPSRSPSGPCRRPTWCSRWAAASRSSRAAGGRSWRPTSS